VILEIGSVELHFNSRRESDERATIEWGLWVVRREESAGQKV
jgi:hypothetical protein